MLQVFVVLCAARAAKEQGVTRLFVSVALSVAAMLVPLSSASAAPSSFGGGANAGGYHMDKNDCPPETMQPPRNCEDVRRMAYSNALRRGYMNNNGNGIPDVMERAYLVDWNDCSTANAHMACMFNDRCTEQHGTLLGLRSAAAWHATTLYRGNDGREFECDFTPGSSGIFIRNRPDARVGPAFPDAGESIDPQYAKDGCETNGASYSALNPGGMFGAGGISAMQGAMLAAISKLLKGGQNPAIGQPPSIGQQPGNGNGPQPGTGQPPVNPGIRPTPTPTPQPVPTLTTEPKNEGKSLSTEISDAAIVSRESASSEFGSATSAEVSDGRSTAAWEDKRAGMF